MMWKKRIGCFAFLFLSWALYSQELSDTSGKDILENLSQLEALLNNIEARSNWQESELQRLNEIISDSKGISMTQGELLNDLQRQLAQMSAISERQSALLGKSLSKSKVLSVSLIVGLPVAIVGTAWITWRICNQ
jgi:hypothetical protein